MVPDNPGQQEIRAEARSVWLHVLNSKEEARRALSEPREHPVCVRNFFAPYRNDLEPSLEYKPNSPMNRYLDGATIFHLDKKYIAENMEKARELATFYAFRLKSAYRCGFIRYILAALSVIEKNRTSMSKEAVEMIREDLVLLVMVAGAVRLVGELHSFCPVSLSSNELFFQPDPLFPLYEEVERGIEQGFPICKALLDVLDEASKYYPQFDVVSLRVLYNLRSYCEYHINDSSRSNIHEALKRASSSIYELMHKYLKRVDMRYYALISDIGQGANVPSSSASASSAKLDDFLHRETRCSNDCLLEYHEVYKQVVLLFGHDRHCRSRLFPLFPPPLSAPRREGGTANRVAHVSVDEVI